MMAADDHSQLESALAELEAVLMVLDHPASTEELGEAVGLPPVQVDELAHLLRAEYDGEGSPLGGPSRRRGFELRRVAGGWRIGARPEHEGPVSRAVLEGQTARLSQAALETLAVIAYRQPVSRTRVAAIRGVSVDGVVRTLLARGLIEQTGQDPETGASLFATTQRFLEVMGLDALDQLPPLSPLLPGVGDLEAQDLDEA